MADQPNIGRLMSSSILSKAMGKSTSIKMSQVLSRRTAEDYSNRRTKIVCTMGPACDDKLLDMIDSGMNVARLNFSHGDHASHAKTVELINQARGARPYCDIAILLDTKGPEIRTGMLKGGKAVELKRDQKLRITTDYTHQGDATQIACSYAKLATSVKPGCTILMADGSISAQVTECGKDYVDVIVGNDATLGERKNMNLPGVKVDLPCVGEKEKTDILEFAIPMGCHLIAASFVQQAKDVLDLRDVLGERGRHIRIISKIENVEGLLNFDEILAVSDGIMVARGDLGMEIPPEKVFLAQKRMIAQCNLAGKPVITATQMLESMCKSPRPTRAEAADVANAVLDGTDAVMLSGETAGGLFPVAAVAVMTKICVEAESCIDYTALYNAMTASVPLPIPTPEAVARAAVETAHGVGAALIVALTETGHTSTLIAKYRPAQPILALSASEATIRHMKLYRGIVTILVASFQGTDKVIQAALHTAKKRGLVKQGAIVVAVHGIKEECAGGSNLLKVITVD